MRPGYAIRSVSWKGNTMDLSRLLTRTCEWLKACGEESDIVLSSRLRLARNIKGMPFPTRATREQLQDIQRRAGELLPSLAEFRGFHCLALDEMTPLDLGLLFERHLISKEHANSTFPRSLLFSDDERVALMVNEEDHLRLQIIQAGWEVNQSWQRLEAIDDAVAAVFPYAFHSRLGYLTACPTNVGTGLRVSVMLHLPALRMTNQMDKVQRAVNKLNMAFRGFYGEGSSAVGDFFQLSNQVTLGKTEQEICSMLTTVLPQIVKYEREVRRSMCEKHKPEMEKLVHGHYESLRQTTSISGDATMTHLSIVRMGVHLGWLPLTVEQVNHLFIGSQPAHLQKRLGRECAAEERDVARADFLHNSLNLNRKE